MMNGASTQPPQIPAGFMFEPFFTTLIVFILILLCNCAGRVMRQCDDRRFETPLVTCRRVHVAKLGMRRGDASTGAHRDERAVVALLPRRERVEARRRRVLP